MAHQTIAAVIPTLNVADYFEPTLKSVCFCDEVVVVDMFSTDGTRDLCAKYPNVRYFARNDYIFGNFNFGVEQTKADWILRLDSDEVISPRLRASIEEVLSTTTSPFDSYEAECHLYIGGMRLRNGYGAGYRTTIFRRGTARYPVRGEHEGLTLSGSSGRLDGHYDHFSVRGLSDWLNKYNYYTDRDAERASLRPPKPPWKVLAQTANHFRGSYFGAGNLRADGYLGFSVAVLAAFSQILLELKIWERYERDRLAKAGKLPGHPNASPAASSKTGTPENS